VGRDPAGCARTTGALVRNSGSLPAICDNRWNARSTERVAVASQTENTLSLTPELAAEAAWRLGWLGLVYSAGGVFGYFGRRLLLASSHSIETGLGARDLFTAATVAMGRRPPSSWDGAWRLRSRTTHGHRKKRTRGGNSITFRCVVANRRRRRARETSRRRQRRSGRTAGRDWIATRFGRVPRFRSISKGRLRPSEDTACHGVLNLHDESEYEAPCDDKIAVGDRTARTVDRRAVAARQPGERRQPAARSSMPGSASTADRQSDREHVSWTYWHSYTPAEGNHADSSASSASRHARSRPIVATARGIPPWRNRTVASRASSEPSTCTRSHCSA
jgi:hypothetical protein